MRVAALLRRGAQLERFASGSSGRHAVPVRWAASRANTRRLSRRALLSRGAGGAAVVGTVACGWAAWLEPEPDEAELPLRYDVDRLTAYLQSRPWEVRRRCLEVVGELVPFTAKLLLEWRCGLLKDEDRCRTRAAEGREILSRLGPAFIKAGQALAIRPDLVPSIALKELQRLCDDCPAFPWPLARDTLEAELGKPLDDIFEGFGDVGDPRPVAAASLGQVYRWKLKGSQELVAVKVQRPNMAHAVAVDIYILRGIAAAIRWGLYTFTKTRVDHVMLVDAWAAGTFGELDYEAEAANQLRFRRALQSKMASRVYVPAVRTELTSRRVLVTEWVDGPRLADSSPAVIRSLVPTGVECFMVQMLELGLFHSDPHPGNLLVRGNQLVLLDFGLVAEIQDFSMERHATCLVHLINADYEALLDDFVGIGFLPADVDRQQVLPPLRSVLEQGMRSGGDLRRRAKNFQAISDDLSDLFYELPFMVPDYFALVTRALAVLEGIALVGDPEFDIFWAAYPYALSKATTILGARRAATLLSAAAAHAVQRLPAKDRVQAQNQYVKTGAAPDRGAEGLPGVAAAAAA